MHEREKNAWIDVYDFDGTLFYGDSTVHFWLYCLRKKPALARFLPAQLWAVTLTALRVWRWQRAKGLFLCFFRGIDATDMARRFWDDPRTQKRLMPWFQPQHSELPVVIASASPEVTLAPIAARYGAALLVGTQVDASTGALLGPNCRGQEKINRLQAALPGFRVRAMYTDSVRADGPLLRLAQQRYLVRGRQVKRLWKNL
ncbi:MAG: haloacid dehalogenase-like hydrolase [Oscillospiraceae bacterium]|jgi:phosphoserine phosphatase|nr:haloacid dehalogenase-like hydrolase [Oscillospiraceae bacterium]